MNNNKSLVQHAGLTVGEKISESLEGLFRPFYSSAEDLITQAKAIIVTDEADTPGMDTARELRLQLRPIRVALEKERVSEKQESLLKGKAIDGVANYIKFAIIEAETHLQKQENYLKTQQEKRRTELGASRIAALEPFNIDTDFYDLAGMPEGQFEELRRNSEIAFNLKIADEKKAEAERVEVQRILETQRKKQKAENLRLKREAAIKENQIRVEREAKEQAEKKVRDHERQQQEERDKTAREQEKLLAASDVDKLQKLREDVEAVPIPKVENIEAQRTVSGVEKLLEKVVCYIAERT